MTPASEATSKRPETPSKGSNGDEPTTVPTPGRSGKAKQTINIKAELEKRQGGKPLLNLVVIGRKKYAQIHSQVHFILLKSTLRFQHND